MSPRVHSTAPMSLPWFLSILIDRPLLAGVEPGRATVAASPTGRRPATRRRTARAQEGSHADQDRHGGTGMPVTGRRTCRSEKPAKNITCRTAIAPAPRPPGRSTRPRRSRARGATRPRAPGPRRSRRRAGRATPPRRASASAPGAIARSVRARVEHEVGGEREQRPERAADVLVLHDPEDDRQPGRVDLAEVVGQHPRAGRVVGRVAEHRASRSSDRRSRRPGQRVDVTAAAIAAAGSRVPQPVEFLEQPHRDDRVVAPGGGRAATRRRRP